MTSDLEKSFKAKLRNIAREADRNPADLWQSIVLERFLVRLGQSPHRPHYVLKGGVLLAKYIPIGRETQDLDFLGIATSNDKEHLKKTFSEIASINLNDGFLFKDIDVAELVHPHMAYAGVEVSMTAHLPTVATGLHYQAHCSCWRMWLVRPSTKSDKETNSRFFVRAMPKAFVTCSSEL